MKITNNLMIITLAFLALSANAHAQSPHEQLKQMVQQSQNTPNDNDLREKIIKLAKSSKPSPALPDTAVTFEGRARSAFARATSVDDYLVAVHEYEQALRFAPWAAQLYFGLGETYEKIGDAAVADLLSSTQARQSCSDETHDKERKRFDGYELARKNFEFYLLTFKNVVEHDAAMIKYRIAERQRRFELWRYQWETTCCLGCGGKQDTKKSNNRTKDNTR